MWLTVPREIGLGSTEGEAARDAADRSWISVTMEGQRAVASGAADEEGGLVDGEADRTAASACAVLAKPTPAVAMTATATERNLDEIFMMTGSSKSTAYPVSRARQRSSQRHSLNSLARSLVPRPFPGRGR